MKIYSIVEGHGEEKALPILLRRLCEHLLPEQYIEILKPFRSKRSQMVSLEGMKRDIEFAARKTSPQDGILLLLDADDDLVCELGPTLTQHAQAVRPDRRIAVVLASREYESWFLRDSQLLPTGIVLPNDPDQTPRDAKGFLDKNLPNGYNQTEHQASFSQKLDLNAARNSASFQKLERVISHFIGVPLHG